MLAHLRLRRRVALLAAGVLEGRERDEVRTHVERCGRCRAEHAELRAVVSALEADPLRREALLAEPDLPARVLAARVEERVLATLAGPRAAAWRPAVLLPVLAAALVLAVVLPARLVPLFRPAPSAARAAIPPAEAGPLVTEDALLRIERNLAREHAARYLSEAGDLLVTVAATGVDCDRTADRLDVGRAPERSRALLERRRLVLDERASSVASARGVLDDVESALREVADLPSCVKRRDVERVRQQVQRQQLLMRIRLMTRELEG